jgi:hypothetical protein
VSKSDLIDLAVEIRCESPSGKAWLVHDGHRDVWIPKSQCEVEHSANGGMVVLTLPEWLAKDKELI